MTKKKFIHTNLLDNGKTTGREKKAWNKFSAWLILFAFHIIRFLSPIWRSFFPSLSHSRCISHSPTLSFFHPSLLIFSYILTVSSSWLSRKRKKSNKKKRKEPKVIHDEMTNLQKKSSEKKLFQWLEDSLLIRCSISQTEIHRLGKWKACLELIQFRRFLHILIPRHFPSDLAPSQFLGKYELNGFSLFIFSGKTRFVLMRNEPSRPNLFRLQLISTTLNQIFKYLWKFAEILGILIVTDE